MFNPTARISRRWAALFGALARHPDQRSRRIRPTRVQRVSARGLVVPITLNGHPARYFWDTGANFSITTESEALRLGMTVQPTASGE